MNTSRNTPTSVKRGKGGRDAGGQHEGLRHPIDDQHIEQRLDDVGLEDQGDVVEDHLRDRRSSGAPGSDASDPGARGDDTSGKRKRHH